MNTKSRWLLILCSGLVVFPIHIHSQARNIPTDWISIPTPAARIDSNWLITDYLEHGDLLYKSIFHIAFESNGTAWISSSEGLYRYDGYHWKWFTEKDGLPSRFIRCVLPSRNGELWVATDRGVGIYNGTTFRTFMSELQLAGPSVRRMIEEPDGTIWFCCDPWPDSTLPGGLTSKKDGTWTTYREKDGLPSKHVMGVLRDSQGRLLVQTDKGLALFENGRWTQPLKEAGLEGSDLAVWDMVESPRDGLMISIRDANFVCKDSTWIRYPHPPPNPNDSSPAARLCITRNGSIITFHSIDNDYRSFQEWDGNNFVSVSAQFATLPGSVEYVTEAPDGAIWAVGFNTLYRWDRTETGWTAFDLPKPILIDGDNRVWFSGESTLIQDGESWYKVSEFQGNILQDSQGDVWGFSENRIVHWSDTRIFTANKEDHGIEQIEGMIPDASGGVWAYGRDSVGNTRTVFLKETANRIQCRDITPEILRTARIRQDQSDNQEGIWLLVQPTESEHYWFHHLTNKGIRFSQEGPLFPIESLAGFSFDTRGDLWLYGKEGLAFFDLDKNARKNWAHFSGIPDREVFSLVCFENDHWFGFRQKTNRQGEIALLSSNRGGWTFYPYNAQHFGKRTKDGTILFGGTGQLFKIPPRWKQSPLILNLPSPEAVKNALIGFDNTIWIETGNQVLRYRPNHLPPDTVVLGQATEILEGESFQLDCQGIDCMIPPRKQRQYRYSWRINQGSWNAFQSLPSDGLPLTGLASGRYELEVRAQNEDFDIDPTPALIQFFVHPISIQRTWWFRTGAFVLFFLISFLAFYALWARRKLSHYTENLEIMAEMRSRALLETETKYANLFDNVPDAIHIWDPFTLEILDVNPAAVRVYGYSREEFIRMKATDISAEPEKTLQSIRSMVEKGKFNNSLRYHKKKNGDIFPVEISGGLMSLHDRTIAFAIFRDITENKKNEEKLRFHTTILENMTDWVTATDMDFRITYVSPSVKNILGYRPGELIGKTTIEAYGSPQVLTGSKRDMIRGIRGGHWQGEVVNKTRSGQKIIVSLQVGTLHDESGVPTGTLSVARDITALKQMEEQLQQTQKIKAIGQLAGGISHDFNNLLTGIIGNLNMALLRGNESIRPFLKNAEEAANRAADLVKQLLTFSRKSEIELNLVNLNEVVDEVYSLARHTIDRRIDIVVQQEKDLPPVLADKAQIITALMNLCVNARDAIEEIILGQKKIERTAKSYTILIRTKSLTIQEAYCRNHPQSRPGSFVCISVTDNGTGIPPDIQQHIFEPFYTTKEVDKGTGLGLSSVYGTVTQHNGWIELYSLENIGTSFHIFLPVSNVVQKKNIHTPRGFIEGGEETILIVDDEEIIRDLGKTILEPLGYRVILASDGEEAIRIVEDRKKGIDLILLDISMPKQSGWEVLQEIQSIHSKVKIVLCSGYAQIENFNPQYHSLPHLPKPYHSSQLIQIVRTVLDNA